jgi:hypothetical protein
MKNYTSSVPVDMTIIRIEKALVKYGASHVAKEYKDGEVIGLTFQICLPTGKEVRVRLPANPTAVFKVLSDDRILSPVTEKRLQAQARRTAWKIMQDLVEVQLSMIEMQQAEFVQIFLPYIMFDVHRTFYEVVRGGDYKMLGMGTGEGT